MVHGFALQRGGLFESSGKLQKPTFGRSVEYCREVAK